MANKVELKATEVKPTETKPAEVKAEAEKPVEKNVEEKKAEEKKPEEMNTIEKKAEEVKEAAKAATKTATAKAKETAKVVEAKAKETVKATKTNAKKSVAKAAAKTVAIKAQTIIQYQNNEVDTAKVEERVKAKFVSEGHKAASIKKMNIYIKPEDYSAYYVINDKFSGRVDLF